MPASGDQGAWAHAGAPLLIRCTDRAPLGALLLIIATLWLAAALGGLVGGEPAIIPGLGSAGAYLAGALGAALALIAFDWMVRGRIVVISRGTIAVTAWWLLGRHARREPLADYREVRVDREQRPHRYGKANWYVVRLCHAEPGKEIELARAKDPAVIERRAREYAARCGVPLSGHRAEATPQGGAACRAPARSRRGGRGACAALGPLNGLSRPSGSGGPRTSSSDGNAGSPRPM